MNSHLFTVWAQSDYSSTNQSSKHLWRRATAGSGSRSTGVTRQTAHRQKSSVYIEPHHKISQGHETPATSKRNGTTTRRARIAYKSWPHNTKQELSMQRGQPPQLNCVRAPFCSSTGQGPARCTKGDTNQNCKATKPTGHPHRRRYVLRKTAQTAKEGAPCSPPRQGDYITAHHPSARERTNRCSNRNQ